MIRDKLVQEFSNIQRESQWALDLLRQAMVELEPGREQSIPQPQYAVIRRQAPVLTYSGRR
jgi:hypothetical protein